MKRVCVFVAAALSASAPQAAAPNATGCWVHAFAREPVFMNGASSVIVGPNARLVAYAGGRYRKESLDVGPDTRVRDLAAFGFDGRVDAFKVVCDDGDWRRP